MENMAKIKKVFVCQECGYISPKWMGRCPGCQEWNTMVEEIDPHSKTAKGTKTRFISGVSTPEPISDIVIDREARYSTGMDELDRVMGGGIVKGSLTLIGGDPGIGKSTLLLQICDWLGTNYGTVLYASGEESAKQIKLRADRLGANSDRLYLVCETNLDIILGHVENLNPDFLVIDSIQTTFNPELTSAPGSVSQVRDSTAVLMNMAKTKGITVFIVGHVTKEGALAGPRVLEHMVDTVLYFEGERHHTYRILRGVKNRFGSTNEIGVFEMREHGIVQVKNPSQLLLSGRTKGVPGSVVLCSMEGTRPILVEIQALVSTTAFGMARRMATGVDYNRVALLIAVLEKKVGMQFYNQDTYVNVVGGFKIDEPAADLAIVSAIASSFRNAATPTDLAVMGEVGLTGEIRGISQIEKRLKECAKLGFKTCVIPKANMVNAELGDMDMKIIGVKDIGEALDLILEK